MLVRLKKNKLVKSVYMRSLPTVKDLISLQEKEENNDSKKDKDAKTEPPSGDTTTGEK